MKGEDEHREATGYQNGARVRTGITDVNLLTTEVTHVANRRDRVAGIASSGEFAGVAVQHRLGILPKWRIRFSPACPHYSCSNGQDLSPADEVKRSTSWQMPLRGDIQC